MSSVDCSNSVDSTQHQLLNHFLSSDTYSKLENRDIEALFSKDGLTFKVANEDIYTVRMTSVARCTNWLFVEMNSKGRFDCCFLEYYEKNNVGVVIATEASQEKGKSNVFSPKQIRLKIARFSKPFAFESKLMEKGQVFYNGENTSSFKPHEDIINFKTKSIEKMVQLKKNSREQNGLDKIMFAKELNQVFQSEIKHLGEMVSSLDNSRDEITQKANQVLVNDSKDIIELELLKTKLSLFMKDLEKALQTTSMMRQGTSELNRVVEEISIRLQQKIEEAEKAREELEASIQINKKVTKGLMLICEYKILKIQNKKAIQEGKLDPEESAKMLEAGSVEKILFRRVDPPLII